MSILVDSIRESLEYLLETPHDDKYRAPPLGWVELFCQIFDDTGLSDAIEAGTIREQLCPAASDALLRLSDAADRWDYCKIPTRAQVAEFRLSAQLALRALRVNSAVDERNGCPSDR